MVGTDFASIGATGGMTGSFIGSVFHRWAATTPVPVHRAYEQLGQPITFALDDIVAGRGA